MKEILWKHPISLISILAEACLLLSPQTGTDTELRAQEREETAHGNLTIKCFLTPDTFSLRRCLPDYNPQFDSKKTLSYSYQRLFIDYFYGHLHSLVHQGPRELGAIKLKTLLTPSLSSCTTLLDSPQSAHHLRHSSMGTPKPN